MNMAGHDAGNANMVADEPEIYAKAMMVEVLDDDKPALPECLMAMHLWLP